MQQQITEIQIGILQHRKNMISILNSEGVKLPEELEGDSLEEWSAERAIYISLIEHLQRIESATNSAFRIIKNDLG